MSQTRERHPLVRIPLNVQNPPDFSAAPQKRFQVVPVTSTKYGRIYVNCCQDDMSCTGMCPALTRTQHYRKDSPESLIMLGGQPVIGEDRQNLRAPLCFPPFPLPVLAAWHAGGRKTGWYAQPAASRKGNDARSHSTIDLILPLPVTKGLPRGFAYTTHSLCTAQCLSARSSVGSPCHLSA